MRYQTHILIHFCMFMPSFLHYDVCLFALIVILVCMQMPSTFTSIVYTSHKFLVGVLHCEWHQVPCIRKVSIKSLIFPYTLIGQTDRSSLPIPYHPSITHISQPVDMVSGLQVDNCLETFVFEFQFQISFRILIFSCLFLRGRKHTTV